MEVLYAAWFHETFRAFNQADLGIWKLSKFTKINKTMIAS